MANDAEGGSMKTTMKIFMYILFAIAGEMTFLVGNAQCGDDVMPPDVRALTGMILPPEIVGRKPARVPNFIYVSSADIPKGGHGLGYYEGLANGKWPVILIVRTYQDMTIEILDAQMLPENLIDWEFANGKRKFVVNRYQFSDGCETGVDDERIIFGLVKPEMSKSNDSHFSSRIKQTWQVDEQNGRISPISTKGLHCYYFVGDD